MLDLSFLAHKSIKIPNYMFLNDGISNGKKKKVVFKQIPKNVKFKRKVFNEKRK